MEEKLESFVNLLNRQRQAPPVPKELSGLPNWAQRELVKRPDAAAHEDKPKSDRVGDPQALLARFLAEEAPLSRPADATIIDASPSDANLVDIDTGTIAPASEATVAAEPLPLAGEEGAAGMLGKIAGDAMPDSEAETDADVPVPPVAAEAMARQRLGRRPIAYGIAAAAVAAVVAGVASSYWYARGPNTVATATIAKPAPVIASKPAPPIAAAKPAPVVATAKPPVVVAAAKPTVAPAPATVAKPDAPAQMAMLTPPPASPPAPSPPPVVAAAKPEASAQIAMLSPPAPAPAPMPAAQPASSEIAASGDTGAADGAEPTWRRFAVAAPPPNGEPRIAIVIDDLGLDRDRTARAISLSGPVTLSFLAYASDLPKQAAAARGAGHELIVHVPMEPIVRPKFIAQTTSGADAAHAELLRRLRWDLNRFNGYVGVNNHLGNRLGADSEATQTVIEELKSRGLLFLDSRAGGDRAFNAAARLGVPAVARDILLDDDVAATSVGGRLAELEKIARRRGTAIAIGHPHEQTLEALKAWLASLPSKGLQLVPLTAIVKDREQHVAGAG